MVKQEPEVLERKNKNLKTKVQDDEHDEKREKTEPVAVRWESSTSRMGRKKQKSFEFQQERVSTNVRSKELHIPKED